MTAILKVDEIQDTSGNNIINENAGTITVGKAGNTTNIVGTLQNDGAALVTGKVLQVLTATDVSVRTTTSTSFVTSSNTLSVDITPSSTSSKIFVLANTTFRVDNNVTQAFITIYRDSTNLGNGTDGISNIYSDSGGAVWTPACISVLDSPSSTSQLTYQVYFRTSNASVGARINQDSKGSITVFEVGA